MKRDLNISTGSAMRTVGSPNEYRIIDRVGEGGNSSVFAAIVTRGPLQGALVALRIFLQLDDDKRKNRFLSEAEFLKTQGHPAIVKVLEIGEMRISGRDGVKVHPYQVQKLYGAPLSVALRSDIPIVYKVLWTIQLLSALRFLASDENYIVHRDIKPANVFLDGTTAVLADFGMMRRRDEFEENSTDSEILRTKMPKAYRTPDLVEYLRSGTAPTPKTDIFQLGLVVAEMFFKYNPLKPAEIADDIELCDLPEVSGGFIQRIRPLVQRMLVIDADARELSDSLLDDWDGVLHSIADTSVQLEGRVVPRRW